MDKPAVTPMIETRNLKKYFKTGKGQLHAVDDVSLTILPGQTLGVVGESGCGKSTLGRTILRLIEPTAGRVFFNGEDLSALGAQGVKEKRKDMQIIFQDPYASLNPRMTVSELIAEPIHVHQALQGKEQIQGRVRWLMDKVGLAPRLMNAYPHELDGGRRQRIGIARAIALDPQFIVCDEPVSALDVSIQAQILNLMMDLQDDMKFTYMFITHDLSVVKHISDQIMVMYMGQCVERATSQELFDHPLHPYTQALLKVIPVPDLASRNQQREIIKGEVTSPVDPAPGCRFASRCPQAGEACRGQAIPLLEAEPEHWVACTLFC